MRRRFFIPITFIAVAVGATAALAQSSSWNSGYNGWWPGGYGYPPLTVRAHDYPACSVTVYGPTFKSGASGWSQRYGGGTSCSGGIGDKTVTIYEQVLSSDGHQWFTISGSKFTAGPTSGNPLRGSAARPAYLGHVYRAVAVAKLRVPNGHAGCSLSNTCSENIAITAVSKRLAP